MYLYRVPPTQKCFFENKLQKLWIWLYLCNSKNNTDSKKKKNSGQKYRYLTFTACCQALKQCHVGLFKRT